MILNNSKDICVIFGKMPLAWQEPRRYFIKREETEMEQKTGGRAEKATGRDERKGLPEFLIDFTFTKNINWEIARVVAMSMKEATEPRDSKKQQNLGIQ